ncbi:MAG: hypothetical protein JXQ82_02975 [Methanomicrobiaceae archaeon]|nr:hypothetical protein [Methanomicrobiaceae archaeon]
MTTNTNGTATTIKLQPDTKEALRRWMHENYCDSYNEAVEQLLNKVKAFKELLGP